MTKKQKIDEELVEKARELQRKHLCVNSFFLAYKLKITLAYAEKIMKYLGN